MFPARDACGPPRVYYSLCQQWLWFEEESWRRTEQGIKDVIAQLLQSFNYGPCPSPMVLEYLKETLVMSWASDAALVDQTVRDICASDHCSPAVPVCMIRI